MHDAAPVVCLVDDDESVRKSIVRVLGSAGFKVQAFSEPDAFLRHLRMHSVPVAIMDIWMDNMTGMELLANFFASKLNISCIIITACEDHVAEMTVMHSGAYVVFLKLYDVNRFLL